MLLCVAMVGNREILFSLLKILLLLVRSFSVSHRNLLLLGVCFSLFMSSSFFIFYSSGLLLLICGAAPVRVS